MELNLADVKPSPLSFLVVVLMAILGIALVKMLDARFPIPGVHDLVEMV